MANQTILYFDSFIQNAKELSDKEKDILRRRIKRKKLRQIGRKYKLSIERIRQIEKESLLKLIKKICQLRLIS